MKKYLLIIGILQLTSDYLCKKEDPRCFDISKCALYQVVARTPESLRSLKFLTKKYLFRNTPITRNNDVWIYVRQNKRGIFEEELQNLNLEYTISIADVGAHLKPVLKEDAGQAMEMGKENRTDSDRSSMLKGTKEVTTEKSNFTNATSEKTHI